MFRLIWAALACCVFVVFPAHASVVARSLTCTTAVCVCTNNALQETGITLAGARHLTTQHIKIDGVDHGALAKGGTIWDLCRELTSVSVATTPTSQDVVAEAAVTQTVIATAGKAAVEKTEASQVLPAPVVIHDQKEGSGFWIITFFLACLAIILLVTFLRTERKERRRAERTTRSLQKVLDERNAAIRKLETAPSVVAELNLTLTQEKELRAETARKLALAEEKVRTTETKLAEALEEVAQRIAGNTLVLPCLPKMHEEIEFVLNPECLQDPQGSGTFRATITNLTCDVRGKEGDRHVCVVFRGHCAWAKPPGGESFFGQPVDLGVWDSKTGEFSFLCAGVNRQLGEMLALSHRGKPIMEWFTRHGVGIKTEAFPKDLIKEVRLAKSA